MANIRAKGKIPHAEWPSILSKYGKGETLAQIGRDYGCTAPSIRYIIKRSGGLGDGNGSAGPRAVRQQARGIAPGRHPSPNDVLGHELRLRVAGDITSFLAALDHAVVDGSLESAAVLQIATDQLTRSVARTRLELERLLSREEESHALERSRRKSGAPQRGPG